jgi:hypothetical protein
MTSSTDGGSRKQGTGKKAPFAAITQPPFAVWWRDGWQLTAESVRHTLRSPRWQIGLAVIILAGTAGALLGWWLSSALPGARDEPAELFIGLFGIVIGFAAAILAGFVFTRRGRVPARARGLEPADSRRVLSGLTDAALADLPTETAVRAILADQRDRLPFGILTYLAVALLLIGGVVFFIVAGGPPFIIVLVTVSALSNAVSGVLSLKMLGSHGPLLSRLGSARPDITQQGPSHD